jgi:hypothetical protein
VKVGDRVRPKGRDALASLQPNPRILDKTQWVCWSKDDVAVVNELFHAQRSGETVLRACVIAISSGRRMWVDTGKLEDA